MDGNLNITPDFAFFVLSINATKIQAQIFIAFIKTIHYCAPFQKASWKRGDALALNVLKAHKAALL